MRRVLSRLLTTCNPRHVLDDMASLSVAIAQLRHSYAAANIALDHTLTELVVAQAQQPSRDAEVRARARAEFADASPEALAALIGNGCRSDPRQ